MKRKSFLWMTLVTIMTAPSCTWEQEVHIDCDASSLTLALVSKTVTECSIPTGSIQVNATGGEGPYQYQLVGNSSSTGLFEKLSAGSYDIVVTDNLGCTATLSTEVLNDGGVSLEQVTSTIAGCGSTDGAISVIATSGIRPYTYRLNDETFQSDSSFSGLNAGVYQVSVKDNEGCETTKEHKVLSGISFENSIKPIIASNCALSGCHNGDLGKSLDWTVLTNVQNKASNIKSRTSKGEMPPAGQTPLTQEQKDLIACWVDDGALNN